jgi:hypothetical protein
MGEHETLNDALIECVKAAGGSKVVGHRLWPEKTVEGAQRHLLNCLEGGRAERLSPDKALLVAELARSHGCHAFMAYCATRLHYQAPVPHEPQHELAELQRTFAAAVAQQAALLVQMQGLMGQLPATVALKAVV